MRINTALILCAGFGKRLNPITLKTPKPLLKIKGATLLDHCINLIVDLNLKKVLINSFHLKEQIHKFVKNHNYNIEIKVIDDGDRILDTGGGVLNLINNSNDEDFLIFNPDTLWKKEYLKEISQMIDIYFNEKLKNILLLVNKDLSFDEKLNGDFGLRGTLVSKENKDYIYTGCQILNRSIMIRNEMTNFSINDIWLDQLQKKQLHGFESKMKFIHVTDLNIFKKLKDF